MELREMEAETREHAERSEDMLVEVEDHKERARHLEEAVTALKSAQQAVDSEGLRGAIQQAEEAKQATEARLEHLRSEREAILTQNAEMQTQCDTSFERKRTALEQIPLLQQGMRSARPEADLASGFYIEMEGALEADMNRTAQASRDLREVRTRLESLAL